MISYITGRIMKRKGTSVILDVNGLGYEVTIPSVVDKSLDSHTSPDGSITFVTYHYLQMDPSRGVPVLIGFLNEIERDFFERFISVSGVGPKAACRALAQPFSMIAAAIDNGDVPFLKTLPGIGEQRAREIVAKLQGKVGKYGLIQDHSLSGDKTANLAKNDIIEEAASVLLQLQYKKQEARDMIDKAFSRNPKLASCEDVLNEVYKGISKR